jgi:hypothetical protein
MMNVTDKRSQIRAHRNPKSANQLFPDNLTHEETREGVFDLHRNLNDDGFAAVRVILVLLFDRDASIKGDTLGVSERPRGQGNLRLHLEHHRGIIVLRRNCGVRLVSLVSDRGVAQGILSDGGGAHDFVLDTDANDRGGGEVRDRCCPTRLQRGLDVDVERLLDFDLDRHNGNHDGLGDISLRMTQ